MTWLKAYPTLHKRLTKDAGPCQCEGCDNRATVIIHWHIDGYGVAKGWYCNQCAPAL